MERRGFLRACLAAGGLVMVPKALDRFKWVSRPSGIMVDISDRIAIIQSGQQPWWTPEHQFLANQAREDFHKSLSEQLKRQAYLVHQRMVQRYVLERWT